MGTVPPLFLGGTVELLINQIEIIFVHGAESKSNRNNIPKPHTRVRSKTVKHTKVLIRRLAGDIGRPNRPYYWLCSMQHYLFKPLINKFIT